MGPLVAVGPRAPMRSHTWCRLKLMKTRSAVILGAKVSDGSEAVARKWLAKAIRRNRARQRTGVAMGCD